MPDTDEKTSSTGERRSPPWSVRIALVSAVLLVVLSVTAVGLRWYHVRFPNAAMFIRGDESADGAEVTVSNDHGDPIFHGRLNAENQYQLFVLVEHGIYNIVARRDEHDLIRDRLYVVNGGGVLVQVVPPKGRTPATLPKEASAP